jgi:hypothetical protein
MSATIAPDATPVAVADNRTALINTWGRVVVSIVIVVAFLAVLFLLMTRTITETTTSTNMLQVLATLTTGVVGYWVGSSSGSTAKDAVIAAVAVQPTVIAAPVAVVPEPPRIIQP